LRIILFSVFIILLSATSSWAQQRVVYSPQLHIGSGYAGTENRPVYNSRSAGGGGQPIFMKRMLEGNQSNSYGTTRAYRPYGSKSSTLSLTPQDIRQRRQQRDAIARQRAAESAARFQNYSIPAGNNQMNNQYGQNAFQNTSSANNFGNFGNANNLNNMQGTISTGRQVYKGRSDLISPAKPRRVFNSPY